MKESKPGVPVRLGPSKKKMKADCKIELEETMLQMKCILPTVIIFTALTLFFNIWFRSNMKKASYDIMRYCWTTKYNEHCYTVDDIESLKTIYLYQIIINSIRLLVIIVLGCDIWEFRKMRIQVEFVIFTILFIANTVL
jgi:hypothetical protein